MYSVITIVHIILSLLLVGLVLLQQGKGADVGAVMGSGGANTLFGVSGASSLLIRLTTCVAIMFFGTSIILFRYAAAGHASNAGPVNPLKGSVMENFATSQSAAPSGENAAQPVASAAPADAAAPVAPPAQAPVDGK